jgi:hypothetical protein
MLAAYFGIGGKKPVSMGTEGEEQNEDLGKLLSMFPQDPMILPKD